MKSLCGIINSVKNPRNRKGDRRKPIYRKNQAFQRKTKTERNFITCGGTVMKQKNDLFEELNINPKNRDVCSPFDVDIQAIKRNVNQTLDSAYTERKTVIMKSKKKTACIALAATLALSVTAFAANGIVSNWFSSSSAIADYKTLPTAQQVKNDIGYTPILIDSFANGYTFKDGNIINNNLKDETTIPSKNSNLYPSTMKRTAIPLFFRRINTILRRNCRAVSQKLSGIPIFTTTATRISSFPLIIR